MIKIDDLFRLTLDPVSSETVEQPDSDCRYTPYRIFILETRLYPKIYKMFKNITIYPKSIYNSEKNRMDVYLKIVKLDSKFEEKEDEPISITKEEKELIEKEIEKIVDNYVLINFEELYKSLYNRYPFSWFKSVIEYIKIDEGYRPFVRPEGIYLTFNPNSEYKKAYYEICENIADTLSDYYDRGVVILSNVIDSIKKKKLIENWNLVSIGENLYEPDWDDKRFSPNIVDFLTLKIEEDPYIRFLLPDNLVKRHRIVKALEKESIIFEGSYLKVKADNLEKAQQIAALITASKATTSNNRVIVISASRLSEVYLYFEYAEKFKKGDCITYKVEDNLNPYMFSCLLKPGNFEESEKLRERFRDYAIKRLIEVSKIGKLKNISPHSIVEQEYS